MVNTEVKQAATQHSQPIPLWQIFLQYFRIGLTGFGPALAAETKKHLVKGRHWITEEDFVNGLALAQLLPGATFVSLTVYIGYRLRGIAGALTSFFGFLVPPFSVMVLLSYIYFAYGSLPQVGVFFKGMAVIVAGLVAHAVIEIGKSAVTDWRGLLVALAAIGIMWYSANIFVLLFLAAAAGILLFYKRLKSQSVPIDGRGVVQSDAGTVSIPYRRLGVLAVALAAIVFAASFQPVLLQLGAVFARMGALLFGGGFAMIPFIQQEVVTHYQWLTLDEFVVGIALGQVTPGPILITATFVGYKVASFAGALAATLGIFAPSLFLVMATAEIHQKIKHNLWVKAAIKGIAAAFTGMIFLVAVGLARYSLVDIPSIILAVATFAVLRYGKIETVWVVIAGVLAYWGIDKLLVLIG